MSVGINQIERINIGLGLQQLFLDYINFHHGLASDPSQYVFWLPHAIIYTSLITCETHRGWARVGQRGQNPDKERDEIRKAPSRHWTGFERSATFEMATGIATWMQSVVRVRTSNNDVLYIGGRFGWQPFVPRIA